MDDLVEGQTYQLATSPEYPDGSGGIRWNLALYQRTDLETAGEGPVWCQIESWVAERPGPEAFRDAALSWFEAKTGIGEDRADLVLILPDGNERLRP